MDGRTTEGGDAETKATAAEEKSGCWTSTYTLTLLGFFIFFMQYAMRVNMSVTIVPMAKDYNWDEPTQGLVLGAFFYGYIFTNFLGGRAAELFGGKVVLAASLIITGLFTLVTPVFARWSVKMLVAIRVIEGLAEGVAFPAMCFFMTKWVPIEEKARTATRIWTGNLFGTFVTLPVGGWLSSSPLGWPSVFYLTGALGVILGVVWMKIITDDPRDKKGISEKELKHIVEGCQIKEHEGTEPIPWFSIIKSPSVWLVIGAQFASNACFYTILTELPTYLVKIQKFSLHHAGTISGATYLSAWLFAVLYSSLVTFLLSRRHITIPSMRRLSQGLCAYGSSVGFMCVMLTNSAAFIVVILILNGAIFAACYSGYMVSHSDISPRFSGTLMGIANTIGTVPGFVIPSIVGAITHDNQTKTAWNYVFLIPVIVNILISTPYVFFFKAEVEPWNSSCSQVASAKPQTGNKVISGDINTKRIEVGCGEDTIV